MERISFTPANRSGFSLIELMIALFILTVGLLGIAGLEATAIHQNATSNSRSVAVSLAQGALEQTLALPDTDALFQNSSAGPLPDSDFNPASATVNLSGTYAVTRQITLNSPHLNNMAKIDVTVKGVGRTVTVTGYKRLP